MLRAAALTLSLLLLLGCRGPEPFVLESEPTPIQAEPVTFRAGVATKVFTPGEGYPLGGYGGGDRRSEFPFAVGIGWHGRIALNAHMWWHREGDDRKNDMLSPNQGTYDDLTARALVLRPEGASPVAIVRIDAIGTTAEVHARVATALEDLGYTRDRVLVMATHTHSGMGGYMRAPFACVVAMDNFRPELEDALVKACVDAVREAHDSARPAALGFGEARDRSTEGKPVIAKNRRHRRFEGEIAYDTIDDAIGILRVDDAETKEPLAVVVNYAVHPTVLGSDSMHYSADLAGGLERGLGERVKAPVLFINGAEGDIGPGRVGEGDGLERIAKLGEAFADLVAPVALAIETTDRIAVGSAWGTKELGRPYTQVALGRERFIDGDSGILAWLTAPVALPLNAVLWTLGFTNVRLAITWNLAIGAVLELDGWIDRTRTAFAGLRIRAGEDDVAFLTVPGEATHDLGLAIKDAARAGGATRTFVLGLGLDHIGYIASRREYRRGGYEATSTLFGEGTAAQTLEAVDGLLPALGLGSGSAPLGKN